MSIEGTPPQYLDALGQDSQLFVSDEQRKAVAEMPGVLRLFLFDEWRTNDKYYSAGEIEVAQQWVAKERVVRLRELEQAQGFLRVAAVLNTVEHVKDCRARVAALAEITKVYANLSDDLMDALAKSRGLVLPGAVGYTS